MTPTIQLDELIAANKKLALQNEEMQKLAAALSEANKELSFQNKEKEIKAAELIAANNELAIQNKEKEKRATELIAANKELKLVEEQLKTANQELEAFSYSVSHDLRAPLRAISGFSLILKEDYAEKLDEEANKTINVIVESAKHMGQLIDDLLKFSQLARLDAVKADTDMDELVNHVLNSVAMSKLATRHSITIQHLAPCRGDGKMLQQVWFNLIDNAIKYSSAKEHPQIDIGCTEDHETVTYFIKDNGVGFDMNYYDKLFGVFQRLHRKEEFEGTGLGLSLVKRIVEKHNGKVYAQAAVNNGCCFYFTIPKTL